MVLKVQLVEKHFWSCLKELTEKNTNMNENKVF